MSYKKTLNRGGMHSSCQIFLKALTIKQIFNYFLELMIAVYKTKPIAIGKEGYALKHKKSQSMSQKWFDAEKTTF